MIKNRGGGGDGGYAHYNHVSRYHLLNAFRIFYSYLVWNCKLKTTSTKFVHSCVIQTKSNKFKQSLTKSNKVEKAVGLKIP